ncbi:MAG: hypothetical protein ACXV4B_08505 [Halobacteriota archaeon]
MKRWKGRTADELRRTAYHEAGHAVAHRVVGMVCGEASIVPDYDQMNTGFAIAEDHWAAEAAWERRYKYRNSHSVMRGRIIGYMAGREAEIIAFGDRQEFGDDLYQIELMAEEADISMAYVERLRRRSVRCCFGIGARSRRSPKSCSSARRYQLPKSTLSFGRRRPHERQIVRRIEAARAMIQNELMEAIRRSR